MISLRDYFGKWFDHPDATDERKTNAGVLLHNVNALLEEYPGLLPYNSHTGSLVSGLEYGGFRPQDCPQGSSHSSHKEGRGIDIYDPENGLDTWLTDEILKAYGLYREHPGATSKWCHLTDRAPGSGNRTFFP